MSNPSKALPCLASSLAISCPVCGVGADKFKEQTGEREWAAEHVVGVAQGVSEDIIADLRANFEGECSNILDFKGFLITEISFE